MCKAGITFLVFIFSTFFIQDIYSQCSNLTPDQTKVDEYGDPTKTGMFNILHRGLSRAYEQYGCPSNKPREFIEYIAITKEVAIRQRYDIGECEYNNNCITIIIERKGWEYNFPKRPIKTYRVFTGKGEARGYVYKTSSKTVNQTIKNYINGNKVLKDFSSQW